MSVAQPLPKSSSSLTRNEPGDRELLLAWAAGDAHAGEVLVTRHYRGVARFFINKIGGGSDAEDLIQLTFLGCLEGMSRFRGHSTFRTFLFGIARNKLLKYMRQRSHDKVALNPSWRSFVGGLRSNTSILAANDDHRLLLAAMRKLPLETQMMLELHYWEGLSIAEVAQIVECPANTVKTRMFRARQRIARELERTHASHGGAARRGRVL